MCVWGRGSPPHLPPGAPSLRTQRGQCETRDRLLCSHATGGRRINDKTDAHQSDSTGQRGHEVNHPQGKPRQDGTGGRGDGGGGERRVYLGSIYRVMDDSSLRLLEGEWRERMKEKRECGVAKKKIMRAERECFKSVGSTEAALFNLNLRRRRFHSKVLPLTLHPDGGNYILLL